MKPARNCHELRELLRANALYGTLKFGYERNKVEVYTANRSIQYNGGTLRTRRDTLSITRLTLKTV